MGKTSAKIKRPLWVASLNIALAITVGSSQAFAGNITSVEELLRVTGDANYVLTVNLDLANDDASSTEGEQRADVETSGNPSYIGIGFTGTFDGDGKTISGLTKPLFNTLLGEVKDLNLATEILEGVVGNGALANTLDSIGIVNSVTVTGNVTGVDNVGGLVGLSHGDITGSHATVVVKGNMNVGGLVGSSDGIITGSSASGNVNPLLPSFEGITNIGGLVGLSYGNITGSHATGDVEGGENIGGLVGQSYGNITASYAEGQVSGTEEVGGLVGLSHGDITGSHATGDVEGYVKNIGGLVGQSWGNITVSHATGEGRVSGTESVGGLVGALEINCEIRDSYTAVNVYGFTYLGGLVGYSEGDITNSDARGELVESSGQGGAGDYVGGLVGYSEGDITDSSATSDVIGGGYVGGLVGSHQTGASVTYSYATGDVIGNDDVGGLVGYSEGAITDSYANGDVTGDWWVGGLVGQTFSNISNSYASGDVTGDRAVGGLAGSALGEISNSYASGNIEFDIESLNADSSYFGGLAGEAAYQPITNSYASGNIEFDIELFDPESRFVGGFLGFTFSEEYVVDSYASGNVNDTPCVEPCSPLTATELLAILNTGFEGAPIFTFNPSVNGGRPYLISNNPFSEEDEEEDEVVEIFRRVNISFLPTQALNGLNKSVGFKAAKSDLSKFDLALLDQVKGDKSSPITGAKLLTYQSLTTSLSVGSILQLEINFEANKSLQMWVKSSEGQYVLVGDVSLDKDGNAVLPGIEFKKSGQYELIFVNSETKDLTQPELVNKVMGLTVYVN